MRNGLIALKAASALAADQPLPERLLFLKWGSNPSRYGDIKVNEITLAAVPVNQAKAKFDHVAIDFQHNSVPGTPYYQGEPVKLAARKARVEVVAGEGIYLSGIDWITDLATAKCYPDLSLCPKVDADNNVIFVHSGALCRQGEVEGITFPLAADPFAADSNPSKEKIMDHKKLLLAILGLTETATDVEVETAAKALAEKMQKGEPTADIKALSAAIAEALKPLSAEIDALKATGIERERQAIKDRARLQGKVIPLSALPGADGKGGLDNGALGKLVDELPVTVPMDQRTPENLKALAAIGLGGGSTGADETVRVAMGISKETWEKHNKQ